MANIENGYGVIAGRGRENAQKAIAAAVAAKLDPSVVRTVAEGYLVPEAALAEFEKASKAEAKVADKPAPKRAAPKKDASKGAAKTEEAPAESETEKGE